MCQTLIVVEYLRFADPQRSPFNVVTLTDIVVHLVCLHERNEAIFFLWFELVFVGVGWSSVRRYALKLDANVRVVVDLGYHVALRLDLVDVVLEDPVVLSHELGEAFVGVVWVGCYVVVLKALHDVDVFDVAHSEEGKAHDGEGKVVLDLLFFGQFALASQDF